MTLETLQADAGAKEKSGWTVAGNIIPLLLAIYIGGYFTVQFLPATWRLPGTILPGYFPLELAGRDRYYLPPDYHGLPDWLFYPIHLVDRKLRPDQWTAKLPTVK